MIKKILLAGLVAMIVTPGAMAQANCTCNGSQLLADQSLSNALSNRTVCVAKTGGVGWENQEFHSGTGGGSLIDYKLGAGHPVDPTETVGTWSVTGSGPQTRVNHVYGGTTYTYGVCSSTATPGAGATIGFCVGNSNAPTISATLKTGSSGCT